MALRILFRPKTKKYPQNTFRVHKRIGFPLCTLTRTLFSYCFLRGQLIQSAAAPEQFDVEHQLITGGNLQLLVDAAVVLFHGMNADKGQIRNVCCFVAFDVIIQNPPLRRRERFNFFCKGTLAQLFISHIYVKQKIRMLFQQRFNIHHCFSQYPFSQPYKYGIVLYDRNELIWSDQTIIRAIPAKQRFTAGKLLG